MSVFANAGENIQHFASVRLRVLHAVRGEQRQSIGIRQIDQFAIDPFFAANEMPLDFNENVFSAERLDKKSRAIDSIIGSAGASPATASPARTFGAPAEKLSMGVPRGA